MTTKPTPLSLLVTSTSGPLPSATDVRDLMARLGIDQVWSDAAVEQLIRAAGAADRWLADKPDEAERLVEDPAGAVEAMQRSGLLTEPVADLLDVLRSLSRRDDTKAEARSRRVRTAFRPRTVRFGVKPALRSSPPYDVPGQDRGRR